MPRYIPPVADHAQTVSASTRLCAVYGFPVRHSASPAMQNAGIAALAEVAGKLPQLETLRLYGNPNISQQAKDALKAALPNCSVYF